MDEIELKNPSVEEEQDTPLDQNVRLMSPTQMLLRRFFRSKLSILGLIMVVGLFIFCFLGPVFYTRWGETDLDKSGKTEYATSETTYTVDGVTYTLRQTTETHLVDNFLSAPSVEHPLGTDDQGYDVLARLMYGGRVSLLVSFMTVFLLTVFGVLMGGIAGYFGGAVDNIIMRICDVLMCLPGIPILLILSAAMDGWVSLDMIEENMRIYILMLFLTFISWPGTARLVRGQILSLREQEYMVAAEAMGYSVSRKIFKHLVPNVMPQLIVQMSLSLGSMILYEATLSYLNMGIKAPYTAWGSMINIITTNPNILQNHLYVWVPAGVCIVVAVLGFNFVGDGLRDALDPKSRR
ncbi:MAG: ABC transporter permease [Clostridia bacterium]|nr:ABC transporter permease [Clostridia bacterium]